MKRLQISIEPELDVALTRAARDGGVSKAEVVRRCVRAGVAALPPLEEDPVWEVIGSMEGEPGASESVDDVVYGPIR